MATPDKEIQRILADVNSFDEEYVGQRDEVRRQQIIELAVRTADQIILAGSNGSTEETNLLTAKVAEAFMSKLLSAIQHILMREELMQRGLR